MRLLSRFERVWLCRMGGSDSCNLSDSPDCGVVAGLFKTRNHAAGSADEQYQKEKQVACIRVIKAPGREKAVVMLPQD